MSCCPIFTTGCPTCSTSGYSTCAATALKADTLGVLYRAFSAVPSWMGGKGNAKVDIWTKQLLEAQQTSNLQKAGLCQNAAAAQAKSDVEKSLQLNHSCPCNCNCGCWSNLAFWVIAAAIAFIIVLVFTNAAARTWFKNG